MVLYYGCTDRFDIRINHGCGLEQEVLQTNFTRLDPIQNSKRTFVAERSIVIIEKFIVRQFNFVQVLEALPMERT